LSQKNQTNQKKKKYHPKRNQSLKQKKQEVEDSDEEEEEEKVPQKKPVQNTNKIENVVEMENNDKPDTEVHSEIFVRNLSFNTSEDQLRNFFSKYGTIDSLKILMRDDGKSKGIGFVEFNTRAEAKKAIADNGKLNLDGRDIQISFSNENRPQPGGNPRPFQQNNQRQGGSSSSSTVFVGNLSFDSTEDSIREFFSQCGNVNAVRIAKNEEGKMKGFCHVEFDSNEAVVNAIKLAGSQLDGREIRVDEAKPSGGGGGGRRDFGGNRGNFGGRGRGGDRGGRGGFGDRGGRGGFGGRGGRGGRGGFQNSEDKAKKSGAILQSQGVKTTFDD